MRLLDSSSLEFVEFEGEEPETYAILSHTWYENHEEVSYQDMRNASGTQKRGYEKIKKCGEIARGQGYPYFWVDTCCIDKASSAELSEAINSMYLWYKNASMCYAYLSDVPASTFATDSSFFKTSNWFSRGWTLQELIAPREVKFFSKDWEHLGNKSDLNDLIHKVTRIPVIALQAGPLDQFSVAERMSWASGRKTKRIEDRAYSLMGIFGVHMPLLYGEKEKSFIRLQEEIMKSSDDQSLFAWKDPGLHLHQSTGLLACSPDLFVDSKDIYSMGVFSRGDPFLSTNKGLRVKLFLIPRFDSEMMYFASLECWFGSSRKLSVAIELVRLSDRGTHWSTTFESQFSRMGAHRLRTLQNEEKATGVYREVYLRQNPESSELKLRHLQSNTREFRVPPPSCAPFISGPVDISFYPPNCWDPQVQMFTSVKMIGKRGGFSFRVEEQHTFLIIFGISSHGMPWIVIKKSHSPEQAWSSYEPTENENMTSEYKMSSVFSSWAVDANINTKSLPGYFVYQIHISVK